MFHDDMFSTNHDIQPDTFEQFHSVNQNIYPNISDQTTYAPICASTKKSECNYLDDDVLNGKLVNNKPFDWCSEDPIQTNCAAEQIDEYKSSAQVQCHFQRFQHADFFEFGCRAVSLPEGGLSAPVSTRSNKPCEPSSMQTDEKCTSQPTIYSNPELDYQYMSEPVLKCPTIINSQSTEFSLSDLLSSPVEADSESTYSAETGSYSNESTTSLIGDDILSRLTDDLLNDSLTSTTSYSSILGSIYEESQTKHLDGSCFLAARPGQPTQVCTSAPAIPSLPQSLVVKVKDQSVHISSAKFKKAYKRTVRKRYFGSCLDQIGAEDECNIRPYNTRLAKQQHAQQCPIDTIDEHYMPDELKNHQINVAVYKKIKKYNEDDLEKGNFSGFIVSDASCFEGCKPFHAHKKQTDSPGDEINVGTLASCKRLGLIRKMRTKDGDEVVIISPRPKYQIRTGSRSQQIAADTQAKLVMRDMDVAGRIICNSCHTKFDSSKLLVSHILTNHCQ